MRMLLLFIMITLALSGCAGMPIKEGELILNDKTSATMDEPGVGRVTSRF